MSKWFAEPSAEDIERNRKANLAAAALGEANSAALPPHNPEAPCAKCGGDAFRIPVTFHAYSPDLYSSWVLGWQLSRDPCSGLFLAEHLCRTCGRCGYSWQEHTVG